MLFSKLNQINSSSNVLIVNDKIYQRLLRVKSDYEINHKKLFLFKIIKQSDLLEMLTFSFDPNLLVKLNSEGHSLKTSRELINIFRYDINKELEITKSNVFKYQSYTSFNNNIINYLKSKQLVFLFDYKPYEKLLKYHNLTFKSINLEYENIPNIYQFKYEKDEFLYLFEQIANLLKNGTKINNIKIANVSPTSYNLIKKYANYYNIPIIMESQTYYYDIPLVRQLLDNNVYEIISNDLMLDGFIIKYQINDELLLSNILKFIINFYNKYTIDNNLQQLKQLLIETLKQTKYSNDKLINGVELIDIKEVVVLDKQDYVFVVNSYYEHFPKILKDNDIISDNDKNIIGMLQSYEENIFNNKLLKTIIKHPQIKYISYSKANEYQVFQISDCLVPYVNKENTEYTKVNVINLTYNFAPNLYKEYFKGNDKNKIIRTSFTGYFNLLDKDKKDLQNFIKSSNLKLTPSNITTYLKLPYLFYVNNILKINNFEENVYINTGNFFHLLVEFTFNYLYPNMVNLDKTQVSINYNDIFKESNLNIELIFDKVYKSFFVEELKTYENYQQGIKSDIITDKVAIETLFFVNKNKNKMIKAINFLIELNDVVKPKEIFLEYKLDTDSFYGVSDMIKINESYENTFSIIDYKTSKRTALNKDKLFEFLETLNKDYNNKINEDVIDIIQVVLYAYMMEIKNPQLKLLDVSYFSYLENNLKLNGIMTQSLPSNLYTSKAERLIEQEELEKLNLLLENLIFETKQNVYDAKFDVNIRKSTKGRTKLDQSDFNSYHAIAYFNKYKTNDNNDYGEDDEWYKTNLN